MSLARPYGSYDSKFWDLFGYGAKRREAEALLGGLAGAAACPFCGNEKPTKRYLGCPDHPACNRCVKDATMWSVVDERGRSGFMTCKAPGCRHNLGVGHVPTESVGLQAFLNRMAAAAEATVEANVEDKQTFDTQLESATRRAEAVDAAVGEAPADEGAPAAAAAGGRRRKRSEISEEERAENARKRAATAARKAAAAEVKAKAQEHPILEQQIGLLEDILEDEGIEFDRVELREVAEAEAAKERARATAAADAAEEAEEAEEEA